MRNFEIIKRKLIRILYIISYNFKKHFYPTKIELANVAIELISEATALVIIFVSILFFFVQNFYLLLKSVIIKAYNILSPLVISVFFKSIEEKQKLDKNCRDLIEAADNLLWHVYSIICTHYETLKKKKYIKIRYDDYGNEITNEWDKEFRYFFSATILPQTLADVEIFTELIYEFNEQCDVYAKRYYSIEKEEISFNYKYETPSWNRELVTILNQVLAQRKQWSTEVFFTFSKSIFDSVEKNGIGIEVDKLDKKCNRCKISIDDCTAKEFERKVADKLSEIGFMTEVTKYVGDQGADVLAEKNGVTFAIQCKLYSDSVGNKALQEAISGKNYYKADYAVVVTNSHFTKQAHELADKTNSILLHYSALDKLNEYCVEI